MRNARTIAEACAGAFAAVSILAAAAAHAQGWKPDRPLEILIGTSAGGALDRTGRTLLRVMQEQKLAGPKGMSAAQIAFWDNVTARVVKDKAWATELERSLAENNYKGSGDTLKHWLAEFAQLKALYTALGLAKP